MHICTFSETTYTLLKSGLQSEEPSFPSAAVPKFLLSPFQGHLDQNLQMTMKNPF